MKKFLLSSLISVLAFAGVHAAVTNPLQATPYIYTDSGGSTFAFTFGHDALNVYTLTFPADVTTAEQNEILALPQFNNQGVSGAQPTVVVGPIFPPGPGSPSNFITSDVAESANFNVTAAGYGVMYQVTTANANITATLPTASTLPDGWYCFLRKVDTGTGWILTSPTTSPNAIAVTNRGHVALIWTDGTNFYEKQWYGGYQSSGNYLLSGPGTGTMAFTGGLLSLGVLDNSPTLGLGYATGAGAGGAVTQLTSRTTGVTLNTLTGAITLFTVTDSAVAATDTILVSVKSSTTNLYETFVTAIAAGSFQITFFTTGGTTSDAPVFNFSVIKGSAN